jgi:hypothetical protein
MGVEIVNNRAGILAQLFPRRIDAGVERQAIKTQKRVKANIVAKGLVRTGRMLASVHVKASGRTAYVTVEAKSKKGFPYPLAQENGWHDRGGGYHPGNHFVRDAAISAEHEYPVTMRDAILEGF